MTKFNNFDLVFEAAFSRYANGGAFQQNLPVKIKKNYLNSQYFKERYDDVFKNWLSNQIEQGVFFFIDKVHSGHAQQDTKDANDSAGASKLYLTIKADPRSISHATEFNKFNMPADFKFIEILDFGNNLPPVQGVPNKYEKVSSDAKPVEVKTNLNLDNQPKNNSLPSKNTKIKS